MFLSAIIPCYNNSKVIESTVISTIETFPDPDNFELIVVDDASTDHSVERVERLKARYTNLVLLQRKVNAGPGQARNDALAIARGSWIMFVDSDDRLAPSALETICRHLNGPEKTSDILFFDWCYSKTSTAPVYGYEGRHDQDVLQRNDKDEIINAYLLNRIDSSVIYAIFRKELLIKENISFRNGYHEDVDYLFKALYVAEHISCLDETLYIKNNRVGSIVNTTTKKHIDGYLQSLAEIYYFLVEKQCFEQFREPYTSGLVNMVSSRLVRIWRSTDSPVDFASLAEHLYNQSKALIADTSIADAVSKLLENKNANHRTKYRQIFSFFMEEMRKRGEGRFDTLHDYLAGTNHKSWSCFDIHNSVFLAPDEIRTCCKRFFVDGQRKGDVALLSTADGNDKPNALVQDILEAKEVLLRKINSANSEECNDCPFLEFREWGTPLSGGIKYLSLEYHSVCNMRCSYCSDTYYGGKSATYNVEDFVASAIENGTLEHCDYIVWGGGEPTLDTDFPALLRKISLASKSVKQRVITNGTRFIPLLEGLLRQNKAYIVTSIDAGTKETFYKIRHSRQMDQVLSNLKRYALAAPHNVIIKYILSPDNWSLSEIASFGAQIKAYQLQSCNFQISYDFNEPTVSSAGLCAIARLYALLAATHVRFIFLDDLIWQRMPPLDRKAIDHLNETLKRSDSTPCIAPLDIDALVVWGTGAQAKLLIDKTLLFKRSNIAFFVDPRESVIGSTFMGKPVYSPSRLHSTDLPVVIAAVQSAPDIYSQYLALDLPQSRLVRGLIL